VVTTCTEDGHKQNNKTSTTVSTKRTKGIELPRKKWRANFILRLKEQETRLKLHEHDDDDDDDDDELKPSFHHMCNCSSPVCSNFDVCRR